MKSINISITGKVQGVFFRTKALSKAIDCNLKGSVQNKIDGSVYIEAEGTKEDVEEFIEWCKIGPDKAIISDIVIKDQELRHFSTFLLKQ